MKQYIQRLLARQLEERSDMAVELNHYELEHTPFPARERLYYYADVPIGLLQETNDLVEQIVHFAFDTLGAQQLELRVRAAE
jgi:hypothetical protein